MKTKTWSKGHNLLFNTFSKSPKEGDMEFEEWLSYLNSLINFYCKSTTMSETKKYKIHPMVLQLERVGMVSKSNGIAGKYLVGYKVAWKYKREWKRFCIKYRISAKKAIEEWYSMTQIDWENENTLTW